MREDRDTECACDEQEEMAFQHELLESKLIADYQLFRQSMSPLTTPDKSEETLRYEWMTENFNRVKRRVCPEGHVYMGDYGIRFVVQNLNGLRSGLLDVPSEHSAIRGGGRFPA